MYLGSGNKFYKNRTVRTVKIQNLKEGFFLYKPPSMEDTFSVI
jgi:hypothetical protein